MSKPRYFVVSIQAPVSRENKAEHSLEKRVKELSRRGYSVGNIEAMLHTKSNPIPGRKIEKMIKKERSPQALHLDGKLS